MIHHLNALSVTEKLRESLQNSGDDFQFAALESNLAEYANNVVTWHWHDFVEFVYKNAKYCSRACFYASRRS